jgi:hypothetical protein
VALDRGASEARRHARRRERCREDRLIPVGHDSLPDDDGWTKNASARRPRPWLGRPGTTLHWVWG